MDFKIAIGLQLFDNFSRDLFQAKRAVESFHREVKETQGALKKLGLAIKKAFDPDSLWEASEKLEDFTKNVAQATALPLAGFKSMLSSFAELENARVQMEVAFMTKTGLPREMKEINEIVQELGIKLPGSAKDFYRVATALKAQGMAIKDIVAGELKTASYLWVLFKDEVSPEQAAEYMQQFANAFKIPGPEMMKFADELQRLKFASGLSLTEIAYSVKYFSGELNQLKVTGLSAFKIIAPWIGVLKQFGIQGETAGTAIRSVLQAIPQLDQRLAGIKKEYGISLGINVKSFFDESGRFQLEKFLITLRDSLSRIKDPAKRMSIIQELFGSEGMRAIAPLLAKSKKEALAYLESVKDTLSPEQYKKLKAQIEAGGFSGLEGMRKAMEQQASLQRRVQKLLSTLSSVWESFMGTLEQVGAIIGSLVAPSLKTLLNALNDFLSKVADFIEHHKTLTKILVYTVGGFSAFLAILGAVGLAIASFMKLWSFAFSPFSWILRRNIITSFGSALFTNARALWLWIRTGEATTGWLKSLDFFLLKTKLRLYELLSGVKANIIALKEWAIAKARIVWSSFISGIKGVITAIRGLNLAFLTSPWFLVAAAIAGAAILIWRYWKPLSHFFKSLWDKITSALSGAWHFITASWQKVLKVFLWINPITAPIMALQKLVKFVFGINLFSAGKKIIESLWQGIKSFAMKPVETVKHIVQKIRNLLPFSPAKEGPLATLDKVNIIGTIAETIKPAPLLDKMAKVLTPIKNMLKFAFPPLILAIKAPEAIKPAPLLDKMGAVASPVNITVNFSGGINIYGKPTQSEIEAFTTEFEKKVKVVLNKLAKAKFRREY